MRLPLAAAAFVFAICAAAQEPPGEENARRIVASIEKVLAERPDDPALHFWLARFRAELGDTRGAIAALEKVHELGEGFLPARENFARVWGDPAFQAIRSRLEAKLPRLDYAPTAFELDDRALLPEGIAYDAPSKTFFLGSVKGVIVRLTESGAASVFAAKELVNDPLLGLAVDAPRRVLYAVATSALTTEGRKSRRNAVLAFDIDSRRLLQRHDVPGAQQLNDVAVAPGGRVFASDSAAGAIYEIAIKGPGPPREVVKPGQLGGANGLAASPDGKRLYVAHSTGLALVDLATGEVKRVANATREGLAAIDGLYQWQGQLVGVQNATTPGRVVVVSLSADGARVTEVKTLLSHHHPGLDQPTTGAIAGNAFYLLAATGIDRFEASGAIRDPENAPRPRVLRIPLPR